MRTAILCLTVLAVLAGCTDAPATIQDTEAPPETGGAAPPRETTPVDETTTLTDPWSLNGAGVGIVAFVDPSSDHMYSFDVARNSQATITSQWSCASGPACALRLYVYDGDDLVAEASGTGPLELTTELDAGSYELVTFPMYEASVAIEADGTYEVVLVG